MQKFTISQLNSYVKEYIDKANLKFIHVEGEISNYVKHHSGHIYFTLKDEHARISCVIFSGNTQNIPNLKNGMFVGVLADFTYYKASSSGQLYVKKIKVQGQGELFVRFEQLKVKLAKEKIFEASHKKNIPEFPKKLGIITSVPSAALKDVLITINNKCPNVEVQLYPTLVQGATASQQIIEQLQKADNENNDTLLLIRGGGSIEDLWCFNDEQLIYTIYNLNTPIISGVGHEHDITLVDFVCDKRAATPTAAAEAAVYNLFEYQEKVESLKTRMIQLLNQKQQYYAQQIRRFKIHPIFKDSTYLLQNEKMEIALYTKRLDAYLNNLEKQKNTLLNTKLLLKGLVQKKVKENKFDLENAELKFVNETKLIYQKKMLLFQKYISSLDALSPLKVLARGYSVTSKDNVIITDSKLLNKDDTLNIRFEKGSVLAIVKEKYDE